MKKIYKKVAEELGIPQSTVEDVYNAYWQFIKDTIEKLPLKEVNTDEEFSRLRTNFNIPFIGKLYCNLEDWRKAKNREEYYEVEFINDKKKGKFKG